MPGFRVKFVVHEGPGRTFRCSVKLAAEDGRAAETRAWAFLADARPEAELEMTEGASRIPFVGTGPRITDFAEL